MLDGNEQDRGKTSLCIYALEKGRLMICYGNDPESPPERQFKTRERRRLGSCSCSSASARRVRLIPARGMPPSPDSR